MIKEKQHSTRLFRPLLFRKQEREDVTHREQGKKIERKRERVRGIKEEEGLEERENLSKKKIKREKDREVGK